MVQWNSAQFSSSLESLSRGTKSFLASADQDKNLIEVSELFWTLLRQSLVQWNSAQFSSSTESLSKGTQGFLDSAG
jgi:hypothetical protein